MITRVVRLSLQKNKVENFQQFVIPKIEQINAFEGCIQVKLFKDEDHNNVFYTISHWNSTNDLNRYRKSELFGSIWPKVKPWFLDDPQAYSLNEITTN